MVIKGTEISCDFDNLSSLVTTFNEETNEINSLIKENSRISVVINMQGNSLIDTYLNQTKYGSLNEFLSDESTKELNKNILQQQQDAIDAINELGIDFTLGNQITVLQNCFSIEFNAKDYNKISQLPNVRNIILNEEFVVNEAASEEGTTDYNVYTLSSDQLNVTSMRESGLNFTGKGMTIAVIDSGFHIKHEAFSSIMPTQPVITLNDIENIFEYSTAKQLLGDKEYAISDMYISSKIPFAFDYADKDINVIPGLMSLFRFSGAHGSHVAGLVAGNSETFKGVAYDAQLIALKAFSDKSAGAKYEDVLAALNDALLLNVDAINMSLGSAAGFGMDFNEEINNVYAKILKCGISLISSAGNSYASSIGSNDKNLAYEWNPDYSTISSSGCYPFGLSVASINNMTIREKYFTFNNSKIRFGHAVSKDENPINYDSLGMLLGDKLSLDVEYIAIPNNGEAKDYEGIDITGKIAVVSRGGISFEEKANIAKEKGAIGIVIYNNIVNYALIGAQISEFNFPIFTIRQEAGNELIKAGKGTLTFSKDYLYDSFISDFSSWGPNTDLTLKPDITAPGGDVISVLHDMSGKTNKYANMSGTSMASPNMAGVILLIKEYLKENYPEITGMEQSLLAYKLAMSTASIIYDENDNPYSPRRQGSGLADAKAAITTKAYLSVTGKDFPKLELGDDKYKTGKYILNFNLTNMSTDALSYNLSAMVMTDRISMCGNYNEQCAYILDGAIINYSAKNGTLDNYNITVNGNQTAEIRIEIELTEENHNYLNQYTNGVFIDGFVMLNSENEPNLSIPFLVFYGDWGQAQIFDNLMYDDENPDILPTTPIAIYNNQYIYMGKYAYKVDEGMEAPEADIDKISISGLNNSITALGGILMASLRNAYQLDVYISDYYTQEEIEHSVLYGLRKMTIGSNGIQPKQLNFVLNPITMDFPNNSILTLRFVASFDYQYTDYAHEFTIPLRIDFETPTITDAKIISDESGRIYLESNIYDNNYLMDYQLIDYTEAEDKESKLLTNNPIPVYNSNPYSTNYFRMDITSLIASMEYDKLVFIAEDYAFNKSLSVFEITQEMKETANKIINAENSNEENNAASFNILNYTNSVEFEIVDGVLQKYNGTGGDVIIPENVVSIADGVFKGNKTITSITFNNGLKNIGNQTFMNCTGLTKLTMPDSIERIGTECFSGCNKIQELKLSNSIKDISDKAFYNCSELTKVTYPTAYTRIGEGAFYCCQKLQNIDLPETVERIEKQAFYNKKVSSVTELKLPKSLKYLGHQAFRYINMSEFIIPDYLSPDVFDNSKSNDVYSPFEYNQIKSIVMPKDWTRIPNGLCYYNKNLTEIVWPDNLVEIGNRFAFDSAITSVDIPDSVKIIGEYAFAYCKKATKVHIPDGIEIIPMRFIDTSLITEVRIPASVTSIGHQAFDRCTKLVDIIFEENSKLKFIDSLAFSNNPSLIEFNMPDSVETMGTSVFKDCKNLVNLKLSNNLQAMNTSSPFANTSIEELVIPDKFQGVVFQLCSMMPKLKKVTFENKIESITNSAFFRSPNVESIIFKQDVEYALALGYNLTKLKEVVFEGSVKKLYGNSFWNCNELKILEFNDIEELAGYSCGYSGIEKIIFKGNVGKITLSALSYNPNLKELVFHGNLGAIDEYVFYDYRYENGEYTGFVGTEYLTSPNVKYVVTENNPYLMLDENGIMYNKDMTRLYRLAPGISIESYVMPDSVTTFDKGTFAGRSDLKNITLSKNLEIISASAFEGMDNLISIDTKNIKEFGNRAFANCPKIESIELNENITILSDGLFDGCKMLKNIIFNADIEKIGDYTFRNTLISSIKTTDSLKYIGAEAFYNCTNLKEFYLGATEFIGEKAFANTSLSEVIFNEGLTEIGISAFENCQQLNYVYISSTAPQFKIPDIFTNCQNIQDIDVSEKHNYFLKLDDTLYTKDMRFILFFGQANTNNKVVVREGVIKIDAQAYLNNKNIIMLELPESLVVIGDKAFYGCENLSVVVMKSKKAPILEGLYNADHEYPYANFVDYMDSMKHNLILHHYEDESYNTYLWNTYFTTHHIIKDASDLNDINVNSIPNTNNLILQTLYIDRRYAA